MSRSAFTAAGSTLAVVLFCIAFPAVSSAQREVPHKSIIRKPVDSTASGKPSIAVPDAAAAARMPAGTGSIMGTALDSLHDSMLASAVVTVVGVAGRHATTTANGLFRIDSIPPGKYVLEVTHPILDSLGIRLQSDTVPVTAGRLQTVELAIPSVHTVTATVCSPAKLRFGPGVILGRVVDADTFEPAVGAEVSVAWMETEVDATVGVRTSPRVRKSTVASDGTYRICGVPPNFTGSLQASLGGAKTAEVPIQVLDQALSLRILFMPPPAVASSDTGSSKTPAPRGPRAVVTGRVTNAGGVPVSGARVSMQGGTSSAATGADGRFTLTGVMPGTQSILVRRVGYTPVETALDLTSLKTNEVTVRLGAYTPVLTSVDVKAKADPIESTGFERRRKMGLGKYMDLAQIQAASPTYTSDILRRIPGLYVTGSGASASIATTRSNGCVGFVIDNNPVSSTAGQSIDEIVNENDIVAVEFYQPVEVPMEFANGQSSGCAMLLIWTKGKLDQRSRKK
ncbi:MAG: carboxypeptidase-like regulatory domain-containing protein [Gemmatimonadota bacterium]|nr:carboxypeptidase-like regulatory domain-containing protein [Gemmatimonadota bacterium]